MTIRTIMTHDAEANEILENKIRFMFRGDKEHFKVNDVIHFRVMKGGKEILHKINSKAYVITAIVDHANAPIEDGFLLIGFRELR